jgi:hypothetical protein
MTAEKRWLDELPFESPERELLEAGKGARPHGDDVDANWRAFCVAAGGAGAAAASSGAAHAASAKAVSGFVSKAGVGGLLNAAMLKTFAVGIALGVGVSGTSVVVQRIGQRDVRPVPVEVRRVTATERMHARVAEPAPAAPSPLAAEVREEPPISASAPRREVAERAVPVEPLLRAAPSSLAVPPEVPAPATVVSVSAVAADGASLSAQARELAQVKRLLDAGETLDALRRLEASSGAGAASSLSEERDALYVQALESAGRLAEAKVRARVFVSRYPRSPYVATIRRVAEE